MLFIALFATGVLVWALTGTPVSRHAAAFAGFACGFSWALLVAMRAIEKSGL
jgi:hypothetical protein